MKKYITFLFVTSIIALTCAACYDDLGNPINGDGNECTYFSYCNNNTIVYRASSEHCKELTEPCLGNQICVMENNIAACKQNPNVPITDCTSYCESDSVGYVCDYSGKLNKYTCSIGTQCTVSNNQITCVDNHEPKPEDCHYVVTCEDNTYYYRPSSDDCALIPMKMTCKEDEVCKVIGDKGTCEKISQPANECDPQNYKRNCESESRGYYCYNNTIQALDCGAGEQCAVSNSGLIACLKKSTEVGKPCNIETYPMKCDQDSNTVYYCNRETSTVSAFPCQAGRHCLITNFDGFCVDECDKSNKGNEQYFCDSTTNTFTISDAKGYIGTHTVCEFDHDAITYVWKPISYSVSVCQNDNTVMYCNESQKIEYIYCNAGSVCSSFDTKIPNLEGFNCQ